MDVEGDAVVDDGLLQRPVLEQHHAERHHEWVENQAPSGWLPRPALRELWRFRALAIVLARNTRHSSWPTFFRSCPRFRSVARTMCAGGPAVDRLGREWPGVASCGLLLTARRPSA
jgi:hypothetical protein